MIKIYGVAIVGPYGATKVVDQAAGSAAEAEAIVSAAYPNDYAVFAHFECCRDEVVVVTPVVKLAA
jgi:hypothetical protein